MRLSSWDINPVNLRGLKQALFVLQSLERGKKADEIVYRFNGDGQLLKIWTNFMIRNHWIIKIKVDSSGDSRYIVTDKGMNWLNRLKTQNAEVS